LFEEDGLTAEQLQPTGEKESPRESADTGKARKVCGRNFHNYKKMMRRTATLWQYKFLVWSKILLQRE